MKLLKNLKTGVHHYANNGASLCRTSRTLKPGQWIEVEGEPRSLKAMMCYRCDELVAQMKRTGGKRAQD